MIFFKENLFGNGPEYRFATVNRIKQIALRESEKNYVVNSDAANGLIYGIKPWYLSDLFINNYIFYQIMLKLFKELQE